MKTNLVWSELGAYDLHKEFSFENITHLRDLACNAMKERDSSGLFGKISMSKIVEGLIKVSQKISAVNENVQTNTFFFTKALLFIPDDQIPERIYNMECLEALYKILMYDPEIPQQNRVDFISDFRQKLSSMKSGFDHSDDLTEMLRYAFALVYFRDVVIARFADETITNPLNMRLDGHYKKIFLQAISEQGVEKCTRTYDTAPPDIKRGLCLTIKGLCSHLRLFSFQAREDKVQLLIKSGLLTFVRKALQDDNRVYCIDIITYLFEAGISTTITLIRDEHIIQDMCRSMIGATPSFIIAAFGLLQNIIIAAQQNTNIEREFSAVIIPDMMELVTSTISAPKQGQPPSNEVLMTYFAPFVSQLTTLKNVSVHEYLTKSGVFTLLINRMETTSPSGRLSIIRSLRDIANLSNPEVNAVLLNAGIIEHIKKMLPTLKGIASPIAEQILDKFSTRKTVTPTESKQTVEYTDGIEESKMSPAKMGEKRRPSAIPNEVIQTYSLSKRRISTNRSKEPL